MEAGLSKALSATLENHVIANSIAGTEAVPTEIVPVITLAILLHAHAATYSVPCRRCRAREHCTCPTSPSSAPWNWFMVLCSNGYFKCSVLHHNALFLVTPQGKASFQGVSKCVSYTGALYIQHLRNACKILLGAAKKNENSYSKSSEEVP